MKKTPQTLFEKVYQSHIVSEKEGYPDVIYIDTHLVHEVTSPQAFQGLREKGLKVHRPDRTFATVDHNVPTKNQHLPPTDVLSKMQMETLAKNCEEFGIELYDLKHQWQGIVHVIGPELGISRPGITLVCGDSHTSTHGAFGAIAFGIGSSEVEMVLATQTLMQVKPKTMKLNFEGSLAKGVTAKDLILYTIARLGTGGATGYFVEYSGQAIREMSMEARMTLCNMSIEMGARGGIIAPDETTYSYLKGRHFSPKEEEWDRAVEFWKTLVSDEGAVYDRVETFDVSHLSPFITFGTHPGMGISLESAIPAIDKNFTAGELNDFNEALHYMGFKPGEAILEKPIDYVFIGSCTNSRIEDLRLAASLIQGRKKAGNVEVWVVPGSKQVALQAEKEGLDKLFVDAGFEFRGAGCSACLAMNEDKIPAGKYCISTSNRNFKGRQGPASRTLLASPLTAVAAALTGKITDPRTLF